MLLLMTASTQQRFAQHTSFSAAAKIASGDFAPQHRPFHSSRVTALAPGDRPFTAFSYIKFDRKQNTRLWPFIFTGITRSPPASN
jgi:hypothetical protein